MKWTYFIKLDLPIFWVFNLYHIHHYTYEKLCKRIASLYGTYHILYQIHNINIFCNQNRRIKMEACWHCKRHYNKCSFLFIHNTYIYGNSWHHKTYFASKLEKPQGEANLCLVNAYTWMFLYTSCFVMFFVFVFVRAILPWCP